MGEAETYGGKLVENKQKDRPDCLAVAMQRLEENHYTIVMSTMVNTEVRASTP